MSLSWIYCELQTEQCFFTEHSKDSRFTERNPRASILLNVKLFLKKDVKMKSTT